MALEARPLWTNWSKGELSPLIERRKDLAAYFEGASIVENFLLMRQGGVYRRPGTRFIREVKDSNQDTILLPFETSVDDAFILEMGNGYDRIYKNRAYLGVEVASPYPVAALREVHYTQSNDVMWRFHNLIPQHKTSRITDTNWSTAPVVYDPPPSFPDDTDLSQGTISITPSATTGSNVLVTASAAVFLEADVGRIIIVGASRAIITAFGASAADTASPNDHVRVTVLNAFPNLNPIHSGSWFVRLAPQTTLDPPAKGPVGAFHVVVAGVPAFRAADVGKFIKVYAGLLRIFQFISVTEVGVEYLAEMTGVEAVDPAAAAAGTWGLEVSAWSPTTGYPGTGELFDQRLWQARTVAQPTTFWASEADDYDKYAVGIEANKAIDYTIAEHGFNQIQSLADNAEMFIQTSGTELRASSGKTDEPFGGDVIPLVRPFSEHGSAMIQPIVLNKRVLFIDRSRRQIYSIAFSIEEDGFDAVEITGAAEHITESKIRMGPWAIKRRLDPQIYFVREDGTLVCLTYHNHEKVIGFARLVTNGLFEAVAVIPGTENDQVWVIVQRTINGVTKRYVEMLEDDAPEMAQREWKSCQTDCAKLYVLEDIGDEGATVLDGLEHLEGRLVDIVADGSYRGTATVVGGRVTLVEPAFVNAEVGIPYQSVLRSMRPALKEEQTEGLWRQWIKLWVSFHKSLGGVLNGQEIQYEQVALGTRPLFTGDRDVTGYPDTSGLDGKITLVQNKPYPMTVLALFGEIKFSDHG